LHPSFSEAKGQIKGGLDAKKQACTQRNMSAALLNNQKFVYSVVLVLERGAFSSSRTLLPKSDKL
jgi:hypothetical protein